jgi:hypothetical protein
MPPAADTSAAAAAAGDGCGSAACVGLQPCLAVQAACK